MNTKKIVIVATFFFFAQLSCATQRVASLPYITGDGFRALADFVIDETTPHEQFKQIPKFLKDGQIIFIGNDIWTNTDFISVFFNEIHPYLRSHYILIIANMDLVFNGPLSLLLDDPKLIACFCRNVDRVHPKLIPIPIGIENEWVLKEFRSKESKDITNLKTHCATLPKDIFLYMNFSTHTYPAEREKVYNLFKDQHYCTVAPGKALLEYLHDLARSKFTLSPRGNGEDCHRTWEAMLMGCIPIVRSSALDPLFSDLPVLIVKDWQEITQEQLERTYVQMSQQSFNYEKLYFSYWSNLIKKTQSDYLRSTITAYFGVPFHDSMEQTNQYNKEKACKDPSWNLTINAYNTHIIDHCEYSPEPRIPKIIHRIWLGSPQPLKESYYEKTWLKHHPDWEYKLWTDKEIQALHLVNEDMYNASGNWGEKSDIARYEILLRFGGLYIDTDFKCLQSFNIFHHCCDFYAGLGFNVDRFEVLNGLIGCMAGHPILQACVFNLQKRPPHGDPIQNILYYTGPSYFTRCILQHLGTDPHKNVLFPVTYFYPFLPGTPAKKIKKLIKPETYASHHWHCSWQR